MFYDKVIPNFHEGWFLFHLEWNVTSQVSKHWGKCLQWKQVNWLIKVMKHMGVLSLSPPGNKVKMIMLPFFSSPLYLFSTSYSSSYTHRCLFHVFLPYWHSTFYCVCSSNIPKTLTLEWLFVASTAFFSGATWPYSVAIFVRLFLLLLRTQSKPWGGMRFEIHNNRHNKLTYFLSECTVKYPQVIIPLNNP